MQPYRIKKLAADDEIHAALKLAESVFMQFEAPFFSKRGTESFLEFIWGDRVRDMLTAGSFVIWAYCAGDLPLGMIALRDCSHISLLFVRGDRHRQGIGRALLSEAARFAAAGGTKKLTVNASEYGLPFYRAMGFRATDMQLISDGIPCTPMAAGIRRLKRGGLCRSTV